MNDLKLLREASGVSTKELLAAVQEKFPRYDKTLLSKCTGDGYGVQLDPEAMKMLYERFAPDLLAAQLGRRKDRHLRTNRITCRLEDDEYEALQQAADDNGVTIQQLVRSELIRDLAELEYLPKDYKWEFENGLF